MWINRFKPQCVCGISAHTFSRPQLFGLDDMAGAALVGSGLSFIGGIFGNKSQSDANKMNYKIWREQLQENEKNRSFQTSERLSSQDFNASQSKLAFERSLEAQQIAQDFAANQAQIARESDQNYNSMVSQVERARAAGLNPALVVGSPASVGSSAASGTSATAPAASSSPMSGNGSPSAPTMLPTTALSNSFSSIAQNVMTFAERQSAKRKLDEETKAQDINNQFLAVKNINEIEALKAEISKNRHSVDYIDMMKSVNKLERDFLDSTFKDRAESVKAEIQNKRAQTNLLREQAATQIVQRSLLRSQLAYYPQIVKAQISEIASRIAVNNSSILVNHQQVRTLSATEYAQYRAGVNQMAQAIKNGAKLHAGKVVSYQQAEKLAIGLLDQMAAQADNLRRQSFLYGADIELEGALGGKVSIPGIPGAQVEVDQHGKLHGKGFYYTNKRQ